MGAAKWAAPPDLLEFMETAHKAKRKIVYIGFGSIVVSDPKAMTRTVVEAIVQSGVYAILSKGWSDRLVKTAATDPADPGEPMPKQIYQISSIPHDWLFKRIDAACHHGGAGTTGASLRGSCCPSPEHALMLTVIQLASLLSSNPSLETSSSGLIA